jgi:hypothetical protein
MPTKREWLTAQGLAKGDRGRFTKEANEAADAAVAAGTVVFTDPKGAVTGGGSTSTP